ncbi:MAG TPA: hypothetical protein VFK88_09280 [Gallionella sp.]|nr:hypothetical protein [Gallionella sp.]
MKPIVVIICCTVALAWLYSASMAEDSIDLVLSAGGPAANGAQSSAHDDADTSLLIGDDNGFVTSDQKIPAPEDVAQAKGEKRSEEQAARIGRKTAEAEKDGAERKTIRSSGTRWVTL